MPQMVWRKSRTCTPEPALIQSRETCRENHDRPPGIWATTPLNTPPPAAATDHHATKQTSTRTFLPKSHGCYEQLIQLPSSFAPVPPVSTRQLTLINNLLYCTVHIVFILCTDMDSCMFMHIVYISRIVVTLSCLDCACICCVDKSHRQ